jgi:ribonuclease HII
MMVLERISCGVDEAGRGPVIGPMVFGAVVLDSEGERKLREMGVTDSKMLDQKTRGILYDEIKKIAVEWRTLSLSAKEITEWMNTASLNDVEAIKTAEMLDSLDSDPDVFYLDSPDTIPERYGKNIGNLCKKRGMMVAEHKADMTYISSSAASILAKVERDSTIASFKEEYGDIGSGYPSDAVTQAWIDRWFKENRSFPDIVRKKWSTVTRKAQFKITEW